MKRFTFIGIAVFVLIVFSFLFYNKTRAEFDKIENKVIDSETNTKIVYTRKNQIERLFQDNKEFFEDIVNELNKIENIDKYSQISIPFDYPESEVIFYGYDEKVNLSNELKEDFKYLYNDLGINTIYIRLSFDTEHEKDVFINNHIPVDFIFLQKEWAPNDNYVGLQAAVYELRLSEFNDKIDKTTDWYWYYVMSRYPECSFWQKLYDLVYGNL